MATSNRKFRPGSRQPRRFSEGYYSKERIAWAQTYIGQFVLLLYRTPDEIPEDQRTDKVEPGPTLRLLLPQQRGRGLLYNITALTYEELVAMKRVFDMMFEIAEPITRARDKVAQNAFDRGDDSNARVYRAAPHVVVREGSLGEDYESLLDRLEHDARRVAEEGDFEAGVFGSSAALVESESEDYSSEDDEQENDQH